MISVETKVEAGNGREFGYGLYVNAYVTWDDFEGDVPTLYASECIPFGASEQQVEDAKTRVVERAWEIVKKEYMS